MTSMIFNFFAILLLVASCINGTPVSQEKGSHLARRFTGHATYFAPGTGACGATNSGSDYIVAMNQAQYAGGSLCQKTVSIKNEASGKSVQAKVVDKCPGCAFGSLDLSPTVFSALGDMSAGVCQSHGSSSEKIFWLRQLFPFSSRINPILSERRWTGFIARSGIGTETTLLRIVSIKTYAVSPVKILRFSKNSHYPRR
ncbi:hypothetical protein PSHT_10746 [Puccinia striiformis]|uniref:RlpA-like protein double-psi beta-barrel domain-containing protein n=1 Tax=Puccinia striiformis TaxID=27350 RepID=A0A2S4V7B0_9BASI|nr:hypothetical protein PSHT_10746 [Puccinia striiformis]